MQRAPAATSTRDAGKLTVAEKIGYGFGDLASNLFWQMFSIFIAKFYTDVFLLSAATMGTMMLVTRAGDAFIDPLIGSLADRTRSRFGHFRPYLLWAAVPVAVTAVLTFSTPSFGGTARVVYAYVTLSLMMIAYSAINIPYSALLGVLTPDSRERTSASSYRFVMAFLPVFLIVNATMPLATYFGGSENSPEGWRSTMMLYAALAVLFYWATFAMTRERVQPEQGQKTHWRVDLADLGRNRPWLVLCAVGIAALTYNNIRGTVIVYYFDYVVPGGKHYFGPVMTTAAIAFIAGVMVASPLAKRFGKRNFYMVSMSLTAVLTAAFYFVPAGNIPLLWTLNALITLCAAPTAPLVWAMYADTADYSEWKCGRRATGLVFSAASLSQKLGWALGGAGTGWLLGYFGYVPNVAQSPRALEGMRLMMSLIPAVGALGAVAVLWFYRLDDPTVERMGRELAERRARERDGAAGIDAAGTAAAVGEPSRTQEKGSEAMSKPGHSPRAARPQPARTGAGSQELTAGRHSGADAARVVSATAAVPALAPDEYASLLAEYRSTLEHGVPGLCFSPYVAGQAPGTLVTPEQIRARLEIIRPYTGWIRSFSCTEGHERTASIARSLGMRTLVGAWLGEDRAANEREILGAIDVARGGHADLLAVGNEVLLREDLGEDELIELIERVKRAVPGVPVGYVDAYYLFERHPRVAAACDVIFANCYPFWEGCPRPEALAYMQSMVRRAQQAAPGKRVILSETGWPHRGSAFHGARPSPEDAMRYFVDVVRWCRESQVELFYFAAFDEAWKVGAEGDVGAYWGLWDAQGRLKYLER